MAKALIDIANALLARTLHYLGPDYQHAYDTLGKPVPGTEKDMPQHSNAGDQAADLRTINQNSLRDSIVKLVTGTKLQPAEEQTLLYFYPLLKLPIDLSEYVGQIMQLAELFDKPETTIDKAPEFFDQVVLPVLQDRLQSFGVTATHFQQALRDNPDVSPSYAFWLLSGVIPHIERKQGRTIVSPEALRFAEAVFAGSSALPHIPDPKARSAMALYNLLGLEHTPSLDTLFGDSPLARFRDAGYLAFATAIPLSLSENFDVRRFHTWMQAHKDRHKVKNNHDVTILFNSKPDSTEIALRIKNKPGIIATVEYGGLRVATTEENLAIKGQQLPPEAHMAWDEIAEPLRKKFEARDFTSAAMIANAIIAKAEQIEILRQPIISIRSHLYSGYNITSFDVMVALMHPEQARYANGMATSLLHDELRRLVEPETSLDKFYDLPKIEPETVEQIAVAGLVQQIDEFTAAHPLARNAVTEQQRAALLGFEENDIVELLSEPDKAYITKHEKRPHLIRLEEKIGIEFPYVDCIAIRKEHGEIAKQRRRAAGIETNKQGQENAKKRKEREATQKPTVPKVLIDAGPNLWGDVPPQIVDFCRSREFGSLNSLAIKVGEVISRRLGEANNHRTTVGLRAQTEFALINLSKGFLPIQGMLPTTIMHAHLFEALQLTADDLLHLQKMPSGNTVVPFNGRVVQANVVEVVRQIPALTHVISWKQLASDAGADIGKVAHQIEDTWTLDARNLTVRAANGLPSFVANLNRSRTNIQATPQSIVPLEVWLDSYRASNGAKDLPPAVTAKDLRIA